MKLFQLQNKKSKLETVGIIYYSDGLLEYVPLKNRLYGYYYLTRSGIFKFKHYGWLKNGTHLLYVKDIVLPKRSQQSPDKGVEK